MKRFLLPLLFLGCCASPLFGQEPACTPDESLPDSVIIAPLPFIELIDSTTGMTVNNGGGIPDTICINEPFSTVLTLNLPTTFPSPLGEVAYESIDLAPEGAISNLPEGISYACNPPNCIFPSGSRGCIVLQGTATNPDDIGFDTLGLMATARAILDINIVLPDESLTGPGNYLLHVKAEGSCTTTSVEENIVQQNVSIKNVPNPFSDFTDIFIDAQIEGQFNFAVTNLLGQVVHLEKIRLINGENRITFDGRQLADGMYWFSLSNNQGIVSEKMMITRGGQ